MKGRWDVVCKLDWKPTLAGAGASEKNLEPVTKNGPAPQHCWEYNVAKSVSKRNNGSGGSGPQAILKLCIVDDISTCEWGSSSEGADSEREERGAAVRSSKWEEAEPTCGRYLLQERGGVRGSELGLAVDTAWSVQHQQG